MTTIVCLSDTHNRCNLPSVPPCDIVIHSGDATMKGTSSEVAEFAEWFGSSEIDAKHRVFVPGNHDFLFETDPETAVRILNSKADNRITVLNQESVVLEGLIIYGEPRQPWFYNWAFNVQRPDMEKVWNQVPPDTDILVTHGPPLGYGDLTLRGEHPGCRYQANLLLNYNIQLVVCGHIHSGYGLYQCGQTIVANASVCNEQYIPKNPPLVIEL